MLTIITPVLEYEDSLLKTYNSIKPILSNKVKWLIKSAKKFDNEIVFENTKVIYKPDKNSHEALNQALDHVETDFFQFLGAGDTLNHDILKQFLEEKSEDLTGNQYDIISFDCYVESISGVSVTNPSNMLENMSMPFPSCMIRVGSVKSVGGFSLLYRIAGDYDLMIKLLKSKARIKIYHSTLTTLEAGGQSEVNWLEALIETKLSLFRNGIIDQRKLAASIANCLSISILNAHKF